MKVEMVVLGSPSLIVLMVSVVGVPNSPYGLWAPRPLYSLWWSPSLIVLMVSVVPVPNSPYGLRP